MNNNDCRYTIFLSEGYSNMNRCVLTRNIEKLSIFLGTRLLTGHLPNSLVPGLDEYDPAMRSSQMARQDSVTLIGGRALAVARAVARQSINESAVGRQREVNHQ